MSSMLPKPDRSTPVNSLDAIALKPAKATLPINAGQQAMSAIVKDALIRHYGSLKCAAISMGQMDQGQLTRDLDSGRFKFERLECCDLEAKAFIVSALYAAFGQTDPKSQARQMLKEAKQKIEDALERMTG